MSITPKDANRFEKLLQKLGISCQEIIGFRFMERNSTKTPSGEVIKEYYGAGILTLKKSDGSEQVVILRPRNKPTSIIRCLINNNIPMENLTRYTPSGIVTKKQRYHRPSIYMFWFFLFFLTSMILGYYVLNPENAWSALPALGFFGVSLYFIAMLLTRFCYLTVEKDAFVVHSIGRSIRYPYSETLKVNFEFAREMTFTHVMEVLDKSYRYRLFYIGRTSRTSLRKITEQLKQAGIDATCSLNPDKRYYEDKQIYQ